MKNNEGNGIPVKAEIKKQTIRDALIQLAQSRTPQLSLPDNGIVVLMRNPDTNSVDFLSVEINLSEVKSMCRELSFGIPVDRK